MMVHDLATGATRPLNTVAASGAPVTGFDRCLAWSPDSQRFAVQTTDDTIYIGDLNGRLTAVHPVKIGELREAFGGRTIPIVSPRWFSPPQSRSSTPASEHLRNNPLSTPDHLRKRGWDKLNTTRPSRPSRTPRPCMAW